MGINKNILRIRQMMGVISEDNDKYLLESMYSTDFIRRVHLLDRLIENLLPNMYVCDYGDEDEFVRGVVDEIYSLMQDELYGIQDLNFSDVSDFIFQYKSDDLLDYYRERCEMTNIEEQTIKFNNTIGLLSESIKDKMLTDIEKNGLHQFMIMSNMSFTKIYSIVGDVIFNRKIMTDFINDLISKNYGFGLVEIGEDPIFYKETKDEYFEIAYLSKSVAIVDVWGGHELTTMKGEFGVNYYSLDDETFGKVFDAAIKAYDYFNQ